MDLDLILNDMFAFKCTGTEGRIFDLPESHLLHQLKRICSENDRVKASKPPEKHDQR